MSVDEFLLKRRDRQLDEAKLLAQKYYARFHKRPEPKVVHEYFMLFETSESVKTVLYMKEHDPIFQAYDEFMEYCFEKNTNV